MAFVLGFSRTAYRWKLGKIGIVETVLALGTCMVVIAATQSEWKAPRFLTPLLDIGQRSYEVYLTHMFVVLGFFGVFVKLGKPMSLVPVLFIATIVVAAILGEMVARCFSEPMNRRLRHRWGDGAERVGAALEDQRAHGETTPTLAQNRG